MKKSEILKIAQANAERISAIEKHLAIGQPKEPEQLEVGKWYLFTGHKVRIKPLMFVTNIREGGIVEFSGFNSQGKWTDLDNYSLDELDRGYREATPQEVEEALIAEAKRRGFKNGFIARVKHADESESFWNGKGPERYIFKNNTLYYYSDIYPIFKNGKWATIIEQDKFAELKEAHKNGAVIQLKHHTDGWVDLKDPKFNDTFSLYRIKPLEEEKPMSDNIQDTLLTEIMVLKEANQELLDMLERCKRAFRQSKQPFIESDIEELIKKHSYERV